MELQNANLAGAKGTASAQFALAGSSARMPIIVAGRNGTLVAYLASSLRAATRHVALARPSIMPCRVPADADNSGPLCVAASERGQGLAPGLFEGMRAQLSAVKR
jgi:hypothetical protein